MRFYQILGFYCTSFFSEIEEIKFIYPTMKYQIFCTISKIPLNLNFLNTSSNIFSVLNHNMGFLCTPPFMKKDYLKDELWAQRKIKIPVKQLFQWMNGTNEQLVIQKLYYISTTNHVACKIPCFVSSKFI